MHVRRRSSPEALTVLALLAGMSPAAAFAQAPDAAEQHVEAAREPEPIADEEDVSDNSETKLVITAGGVLQTGNTEVLQLNAGALFELVRGRHAFMANANYVLGVGEGYDFDNPTAHNLNGKLRYDFYLTQMDAIFAAFVIRYDRFAGLAPRLQGQLGYMRNFFREQNDEGAVTHRFWGEIGGDITADFYDYSILAAMAMMPVDPTLPETDVIYSGRLFLGYLNELSDTAKFRTGLEALINLVDPGDSRINWESSLALSIAGNLQAELKFLMQVDTDPPGEGESEAAPVDTTTTLNLVYTLL
jgi:putative salt-induced outer membrane protein YdiY